MVTTVKQNAPGILSRLPNFQRCCSTGDKMQASVQFRANGSVADDMAPLHQDFEGMLDELLEGNLILEEDWQRLEATARRDILTSADSRVFLDSLVGYGLLNQYQACRIEAGTTFG